FNCILKRLRILWINFVKKYNKIQLFFKKNKRKESIFNFGFFFLLLILTGAITFRITRKPFYYSYNYDNKIELIFYIYENISPDSRIGVQDFNYDENTYTKNDFYFLLFEYQLIFYKCGDFNNFSKIINFTSQNHLEYIIIFSNCLNNTIINMINNSNEFELLFQINNEKGEDYLYKIK
ncbi:MAG: hypothetical protein ACTSRP_20740, partial [Candidatus Helarchaeota archaeon]